MILEKQLRICPYCKKCELSFIDYLESYVCTNCNKSFSIEVTEIVDIESIGKGTFILIEN